MPKVIVPFSEKGGVGKTTTSVQLCYEFGSLGKTVLAIDLDSSSAISGHLTGRADHQYGAYDVLTSSGKITVADAAVECGDKWPNVFLLAGDRRLLDLEVKLLRIPNSDYILKNSLKQTKDFFDYVIIDTPPRLGAEVNNALYAATHYINLIDLSEYSSNSAYYSQEHADLIKSSGNPQLKQVGTVLNNYASGHANIVKEIMDELKSDSAFMSNHIIRRTSKVFTAQRERASLAEIAPREKTTKEFKKLSTHIMEL